MYLQKSTFSKSSCDLRIASAGLLLFILNTTKTPRDLLFIKTLGHSRDMVEDNRSF